MKTGCGFVLLKKSVSSTLERYGFLLLFILLPSLLSAHLKEPAEPTWICCPPPPPPYTIYHITCFALSAAMWIGFEIAMLFRKKSLRLIGFLLLCISPVSLLPFSLLFSLGFHFYLFPSFLCYPCLVVYILWIGMGIFWLIAKHFSIKSHFVTVFFLFFFSGALGLVCRQYEMNKVAKENLNSIHIYNIEYALKKYYDLYGQYPYSLELLYADFEIGRWLLFMDAFPFCKRDVWGKDLLYEPIFDERGMVFRYWFGKCKEYKIEWLKPEFSDYRKGILFKTSNKKREAIEAFKKMAELAPDSVYARFSLLKICEIKDSIKLYKDVAERYQKTEVAFLSNFRIAEKLFEKDRYRESILFYKKAVNEASSDTLKKAAGNKIRLIEENSIKALRFYNRAMRAKSPKDYLKKLKSFIKKYPGSMLSQEALLRIAAIYHTKGMDEKAVDICQRLVEEYPDSEYCDIASLGVSHIGSFTYDIGDFLAKLKDQEPVYVKIEKLTLCYENHKLATELKEKKLKIRSLIGDVLTEKTSEIGTYEGKNRLKNELIDEINQLLKNGKILDIRFEILIQ